MRNAKIFYQMKDNDILEMFRWYDILDCKKYKELLESDDKEVVRLAIELLIIDGVDEHQIRLCRKRFLHEYHLDWEWLEDVV